MMNQQIGRPIEILLVEDNPGDVRLTIEALKEGKVYNNLSVVPDGAEAMEYLRRQGRHDQAIRPGGDAAIHHQNGPVTNALPGQRVPPDSVEERRGRVSDQQLIEVERFILVSLGRAGEPGRYGSEAAEDQLGRGAGGTHAIRIPNIVQTSMPARMGYDRDPAATPFQR